MRQRVYRVADPEKFVLSNAGHVKTLSRVTTSDKSSLYIGAYKVGCTDIPWDPIKNNAPCFWPPKIWFCDAFIAALNEQLFSVRNRHRLDARIPGWVYGKKIVKGERFDYEDIDDSKIIFCEDDQEWIWNLTGDVDAAGHKLGVWHD